MTTDDTDAAPTDPDEDATRAQLDALVAALLAQAGAAAGVADGPVDSDAAD